MFNKITGVGEDFYNFATKLTAGKLRLFRFSWLTSKLGRYFSKPASLVGMEVLVALSLAVYYFFLMLPMAETVRHYGHDTQSLSYFTEHSNHPYATDDFAKDYPDVKTRLPGGIITGWITDKWFAYVAGDKDKGTWALNSEWNYSSYACVFAAYHTFWVLALFGLLIRYRKDALWIMLGVFSGLMFNMAWPSWQYFFPWDLPSMFFFTWAILTYDNSKRILPLMVVVWLGALFKETTLCCSLLILFGEHWRFKKRLIGFAVTIMAFSLAKKLLLMAYAVPVDFISQSNFFSGLRIVNNFAVTFSHPSLNHVIFVNAGTLVFLLILPWRTYRQMLLKSIALVFIVGIWLFGRVIEFRVWYEVLPLGWMLISETFSRNGQFEYNPTEIPDDRTKRALKGIGWLGAGGALAMLIGVFAVARLYNSNATQQQPFTLAYSTNPFDPTAKPGMAEANATTSTDAQKAPENTLHAVPNLDRMELLNNLAWQLATNPDEKKRDGELAVKLAERACNQTQYQIPPVVGTLAAAYAETGRFDDAIMIGEKALELATTTGDEALKKRNEELLALYRAHKPYHEPAGNPEPPKP